MTCQDAFVTEMADEQPSPAPWYRRHAAIGLFGALALALIGAGLVGVRTVRGPGELPMVKPRFSNVLPTFKAGQDVFSAGFMAIRDKGKDIEILKIEARTTPNVVHIGTGTHWPRDIEANGSNPGNGPGFPLVFDKVFRQHPAIGVRIPSADLDYVPTWWESDSKPALWVIVGFRLTSGEVGAVNGIRVTYKFGGKTKRQFFEHAVIVCAAGNNACVNEDGYGERVLTESGLVPEGTY